MRTVYDSICIFHSDLFSKGLGKTPEGSISLSARAPPLVRFTSYNNENKTGVSSLGAQNSSSCKIGRGGKKGVRKQKTRKNQTVWDKQGRTTCKSFLDVASLERKNVSMVYGG